MKQTAVEKLELSLLGIISFDSEELRAKYKDRVAKAKEIEKQQQNYSEEEVKKLAFDFYYDMSHKMGVATNLISENATNVNVWFEQIKKK